MTKIRRLAACGGLVRNLQEVRRSLLGRGFGEIGGDVFLGGVFHQLAHSPAAHHYASVGGHYDEVFDSAEGHGAIGVNVIARGVFFVHRVFRGGADFGDNVPAAHVVPLKVGFHHSDSVGFFHYGVVHGDGRACFITPAQFGGGLEEGDARLTAKVKPGFIGMLEGGGHVGGMAGEFVDEEFAAVGEDAGIPEVAAGGKVGSGGLDVGFFTEAEDFKAPAEGAAGFDVAVAGGGGGGGMP